LEAVQKFSDAPLTQCPECSGRLRKVFSAVGVVFKGSGFYATDNRSKGKAEAAKTGDKPQSGPADSKPATDAKASSGAKAAGDSKTAKAETAAA
jgi:putative FmdB family regulatory protein